MKKFFLIVGACICGITLLSAGFMANKDRAYLNGFFASFHTTGTIHLLVDGEEKGLNNFPITVYLDSGA